MSYSISTWLDEGEPRLAIVDTNTGEITQQWRLVRVEAPAGTPLPPHKARAALKIQQLTRQLFLLCCAGEIALTGGPGHRSWDDCLRCDRCTGAPDIGGLTAPAILGTRPDNVVPFPATRYVRGEYD